MCPVVFLALIVSFLMLLLEFTAALNVTFSAKKLDGLVEEQMVTVGFNLEDANYVYQNETNYDVMCSDKNVASVTNVTFNLIGESNGIGIFNGSFIVHGRFMGIASIRIVKDKSLDQSEKLIVKVARKKEAIAKIFRYSVAALVSLNYINMGCAVDLNIVKLVLKKPIAPLVGFLCQYITMPLIAYGLAKALFSETVLQLGLFVFGCSPGGGASNMWTVLLKGNLNLSLTMTFISTLAAMGMMPLWLFTLGKGLFLGSVSAIPFQMMLLSLSMMLVCVGVGLAFQRFLPRVAKFCRRILAPVSIVLIIFIIIFGTYANLYMFQMFTWAIVVAATINVWLGFLFGTVASKMFRLPTEDQIAIAVETGVQNTGIAIVLLGFLPPYEADMASVIPVAASIMTPFPLIVVYIMQKIRNHFSHRKGSSIDYVLDDAEERSLPAPNSTDSFIGKQPSNGYVY